MVIETIVSGNIFLREINNKNKRIHYQFPRFRNGRGESRSDSDILSFETLVSEARVVSLLRVVVKHSLGQQRTL